MSENLNDGQQTNNATDATTNTATETTTTTEATSLVGGAKADETTEVKTEGTVTDPNVKTDDVEKKIETEEKKEIVYEDFKLPEGVKFDEKLTGEFKTLAKELGLDQAQAQKIVDLQSNFTKGYSENISNQFRETVKGWETESITMLGPNYKEKLSVVAKAIDNHGTPELRNLLNETGLGNHKEIVNLFYNIGTKMSESKMRDGKAVTTETKSLADRMYPKQKT